MSSEKTKLSADCFYVCCSGLLCFPTRRQTPCFHVCKSCNNKIMWHGLEHFGVVFKEDCGESVICVILDQIAAFSAAFITAPSTGIVYAKTLLLSVISKWQVAAVFNLAFANPPRFLTKTCLSKHCQHGDRVAFFSRPMRVN